MPDRPSFKTEQDAYVWALTEIGAVLLGLPRQRLEELSAWDVPILEAHRAIRTILSTRHFPQNLCWTKLRRAVISLPGLSRRS